MRAENNNFTIARMARLLGVCRSGYYAWLGRLPSARALRRERIEAKIVWFYGEFDEGVGRATDRHRSRQLGSATDIVSLA